MKKIKIFLGSSITEFANERNELENFIYKTSRNIFEKNYNIQIEPLLCENMDNHIRINGTQNAINEEMVKGSDMCFFIFFTRVGEYTEEEFKVAFEKFKNDGKPKIYIYFKNIPAGQTVDESVREFMHKIDNELKHYHGTFDHIDTIKLRMLLNLKIQEMDFLSVEIENGKCIVDGKETIGLSNVSEFANNGILKQLKSELDEIEEKYYQMKPVYEKGDVCDTFYRDYTGVASKRQNLINSIEELQKNIFNMSLRICKDEVYGDISIRQKEAYRLFELGDYEGAMSVLDSNDIDDDFFRFEKQEEEKLKKKATIYIKEHRTAIDILLTMTSYKNRFKEIEERYEKITKVAEKYLVELDVIYDYALYLYDQNQYKKSLSIATKLEKIYTDNSFISNDYDKYSLFNLLGIICDDMSNMHNKAGYYYEIAMSLIEKLEDENPERYSGDLADSYNNAGVFYKNQGDIENAAEFYNKAIEIYERLAKENPERYSGALADSYNNVGVFYSEQGDIENTTEFYHKAIEIRERLAKENPERYSGDLATSYNNVGAFYFDQGDIENTTKFYNKAIEIRERLAKENPERYSGDLAASYNNVGAFYSEQGDIENTTEFYHKAIEIRERLTKENPERYSDDLAASYNNAGVFYSNQGDIENAAEFYHNAIEIYERLAKENPERYSGDLAGIYNNAGEFYSDQGNIENTTEFYNKAIEIYERLAKENPERYSGALADCYNNAGNFYNRQGDIENTTEFYNKAIEIRERLAKENPERYSGDLADSYNNVGAFYDDQGDIENTTEFYNKAIEIYEKLAKENPNRYEPELAMSYFNFALFSDSEEYLIKALEIARRYPYNPYCRQIVEQLDNED